SALIASLFTVLFVWYWGVVAGILSLLVAKMFQKGKSIGHVADVDIADVKIEDPDLFVETIYIMNVGLREDIEIIKENGVGLVLTPKNDNSKVTLSGLGQRQALLHNLSTLLGVYRDSGEPTLIPMATLDLESGRSEERRVGK